jgi:alpha-1,2-mannosyltransferase
MLGQSFGSLVVALECLLRATPEVWCDTIGCAFTLPVAWILAGCTTVAYVHYPTISTVSTTDIRLIFFTNTVQDMIQRVREQRPQYNNNTRITSSSRVSSIKLMYGHDARAHIPSLDHAIQVL